MNKDNELEFTGRPTKKKYYRKVYMKSEKIEFGEYSVWATVYVPTGSEGSYSPKVWMSQKLGNKKIGLMFADVDDMKRYLEGLLKFVEKCTPNARKGLAKAKKEYFDRVKTEEGLASGKLSIVDTETGEVKEKKPIRSGAIKFGGPARPKSGNGRGPRPIKTRRE